MHKMWLPHVSWGPYNTQRVPKTVLSYPQWKQMKVGALTVYPDNYCEDSNVSLVLLHQWALTGPEQSSFFYIFALLKVHSEPVPKVTRSAEPIWSFSWRQIATEAKKCQSLANLELLH